MYLFENMIDLAMRDDGGWSSDAHRQVAINSCLANPLVNDMGTLCDNVKIINSIDAEEIKKITGDELLALGCYF